MEFGPIQYGMLNPYETSILSRRPLRRGDVHRLYRSTLQRFLHGNGMQCDRNAEKNILVDMVFHLVEEDSVNMPDWQYSEQNIPQPIIQAFTSEHFQFPLDQCDCHECLQTEPPVAPAEEVEDLVPTCQAQLNFEDYFIYDEDNDYQEYVDASECFCSVPIPKLLENVTLSADSERTFMSMTESPAKDLVQFLQNFGVEVAGVGCRVHLLMLLRDLLDEQARVFGETTGSNQSAAAPTPVLDAAEASASTGPAQVAQLTQDFSRAMIENLSTEVESTATATPAADAAAGATEADPMRECCICLQNPREVAFVPCGHALCCRTCARKLRDCPVCRKRVQRRLKLFFS